MHPHSYPVESQSRAQDLASTILASSTPIQISAACASIESFLHSHSPDQSRHFFSLSFPALICKLFGFDDATPLPPSPSSPLPPPSSSHSSRGWIDSVLASNDSDLSNRIFTLLSPNGVLLSSIAAVDRLSLVKYVFPVERLPEWTRYMLSSDKDCRVLSDLCPIFKGRVKQDAIKASAYQIQLNVFEYYMFWFAYYPVCRGNNESSYNISPKRNRRFKLENWVSSISGFSSARRGSEQKIESILYVRLLYAYLREFVPIYDLSAHQPYRSSLLHYSSSYDRSVIMRAEFVVNTLIHFWLVDNDFSPMPSNVWNSFGVSFPIRSVLGESPPTAGLGQVVKLFVKYLNFGTVVQCDGNENVGHSGSPKWKTSGSFDARYRDASVASLFLGFSGSWNLLIQRPLYRFILRTFLFCPIGTSIRNASEVFSVWISYMQPWMISLDDFLEFDSIVDGSAKILRNEDSKSQTSGYTASWQGYVLSNYLYYSSLVMHFIGFAHKFLHADAEIIVQMILKVINILTTSKELTDLIRTVDSVIHSKQAESGQSMFCRYVPSIREQLQDWEDGLCESDVDGSFLHENWNKDLHLFSDGEDGGQQLLQLFILRAEAELQAISGDNLANNLQCLDSLKAKASCLFGGHNMKPLSLSLEPKQPLEARDEIFTPRRVSSRKLADVKYKGDWMNRPISDDEIAWLARLLVWFSSWLNDSLGLNQPECDQGGPTRSYIKVSKDDFNKVCGSKEITKAVFFAVSSWFLMLGASVLKLMRKHGLRVNLRMFASKKVVMILLLSAVFCILKNTFKRNSKV